MDALRYMNWNSNSSTPYAKFCGEPVAFTKPKVDYSNITIKPKKRAYIGLNAIEKVIFNDPATIVFWDDRTKTVVKCCDDEPFDMEKGLAMAIAKKAYGNQGSYYNEFKKWIWSK